MKFADAGLHQLPLRCSSEQQWCRGSCGLQLPDQSQPWFAGVLDPRGAVGEHHDVRADRGVQRGCPGQLYVGVLDRAGLQDVECLAARDSLFRVDEPHLDDAAAAGQLVRECPAQRTGADDRNNRHQE